MWWKYVLQSFSAVALMFFTGLFLVAVGLGFSVFTVVNTLGPPVASPGTVLLAVAPLLSGLHFLVSAHAARHPGRQPMSQQVEVDRARC